MLSVLPCSQNNPLWSPIPLQIWPIFLPLYSTSQTSYLNPHIVSDSSPPILSETGIYRVPGDVHTTKSSGRFSALSLLVPWTVDRSYFKNVLLDLRDADPTGFPPYLTLSLRCCVLLFFPADKCRPAQGLSLWSCFLFTLCPNLMALSAIYSLTALRFVSPAQTCPSNSILINSLLILLGGLNRIANLTCTHCVRARLPANLLLLTSANIKNFGAIFPIS